MGLSDRIRRWALARPRVLIIAGPGSDRLRWLLEAEADRRGWPLALAPADADLLLTIGPLGPELSVAVDNLWSQVPAPRHRAAVTREEVAAQLDAAARALAAPAAYAGCPVDPAALLNAPHHAGHEDHPMEEHEETGHSHHTNAGHQMGHDDAHGEDAHGEGAHGGHQMDHMDHGGGVAGLPMAGTAPDRDGLELDELNITLGPILPAWPAGLIVHAALQGDVLSSAAVSWVDDTAPAAAPTDVAAQRAWAVDVLARFLVVAGWPRAARQARAARTDLAGFDASDAARGSAAATRLARTVSRSRTLAWSVRGLGRSAPGHAAEGQGEDVWERVLRWCTIAAGLETPPERAAPVLGAAELQDLLVGAELAAARLIVASVDPRTAVRGPGGVR